jgi:hypothetical protein
MKMKTQIKRMLFLSMDTLGKKKIYQRQKKINNKSLKRSKEEIVAVVVDQSKKIPDQVNMVDMVKEEEVGKIKVNKRKKNRVKKIAAHIQRAKI